MPNPSPVSNPDPWHLAQLKPNSLDRALTNLTRQGFGTFVPRQRAGKGKALPLFPGYVFVQFDPGRAQWHSINNTYGVSKLVALRGSQPDQVPEPVMQALFARCDADGCLLPPEDLQTGDQVEIIDGPFAGWVSKVSAMSGPDRVMVLLSLLGEETRTTVPVKSVQKL